MAARGGRRQGTPGKSYANRTDLQVSRAPQSGMQTAASGGYAPPAQSGPGPGVGIPNWLGPDQVPTLDEPTHRPGEPVTAGLPVGPGAGPEAIGAVPMDPTSASLHAAYLVNPTPQLRRALMFLNSQAQ